MRPTGASIRCDTIRASVGGVGYTHRDHSGRGESEGEEDTTYACAGRGAVCVCGKEGADLQRR